MEGFLFGGGGGGYLGSAAASRPPPETAFERFGDHDCVCDHARGVGGYYLVCVLPSLSGSVCFGLWACVRYTRAG